MVEMSVYVPLVEKNRGLTWSDSMWLYLMHRR